MTEKEIVQGCIKEDRHCQQALFVRYAGKMLAVCMRYTRHRMEAEDILQDAFVKVFDNIHKFQFKGSFEGWIRRIVINTALKNYSKKSFQQEQIGLENQPEYSTEPESYKNLEQEEMLRLINQLPEGYLVVFNLYAIEGYSHKEISDMLGIQESTSRSQLVKARKMLQGMIVKIQKIAV
ncbi:MAG: RNA polymerase sigma factor [Phaeodactylibacter xiamenensis]|uniref:ECF subfamily RNA polymerase sigma-24 subunit n=1 Tax=Phaeodactylibacter xiamenensis TaxID=1524460 RepID=A0A098S6U9_9BACT|nr:sigma-70 family RNA polymerase sigma factor [Phaeodactylibacter xiamenensis]KGE87821.1 ECF subfamily RNA polymerase sigma-24 subunit [Phaeodactylibacter xiamenensis]MCR9053707.1 sigma-70 family RNA polymerase sigma factor [bacterium]